MLFDTVWQKSWTETNMCWWSVAKNSKQVCIGHEAGCGSYSIIGRRIKRIVNRSPFLHNVEIICSSIARYVKNCYWLSNRLFIIGGEKIQPVKGTTQGDLAAMVIYAIAITPMILILVEISL